MDLSMQPSDEILVKRAKEGDRNSFDVLYQKYKKRILNYIYRMVGNQTIAEDLTQETFVRAYINLPNYRERLVFSAWLYKIAGNLVKNEMRAAKYRASVSLDAPLVVGEDTMRLIDTVVDKNSAPDLVARSNELHEAIQKVLDALSYDHRSILVLCDIHGYSYEEVSKMFEVSVGTVASRLSRARKEFNKKLRIEYDIDKDVI